MNTQDQHACDYNNQHEWGPLRAADQLPDGSENTQWMVRECKKCGRLKWVRNHKTPDSNSLLETNS